MIEPKCARCSAMPCRNKPEGDPHFPPYCPMVSSPDLAGELIAAYGEADLHKFYIAAAETEKECYDEDAARREGRIVPLRPRIREVVEFAKKIKAFRLGMAFCSGLSEEAKRAAAIFEKHGIEVVSVVCSCGSVDKEKIGVAPAQKVWREKGFEAACNPLIQAEILNRSDTSFNVIVGLCVGHDMIFTRRSRAPVTTLIVKDRFTGHNPVISLYSRYHKDIV